MPKKKLQKKLDKCFISIRVKTDKHIRDSAYRNIKKVEALDIKNIHERILKAMNIKSLNDSKYFEYNNFHALLQEVRVLTKRTDDDLEPFDLI